MCHDIRILCCDYILYSDQEEHHESGKEREPEQLPVPEHGLQASGSNADATPDPAGTSGRSAVTGLCGMNIFRRNHKDRRCGTDGRRVRAPAEILFVY